MRYDTPIYFQKLTPGEYDPATGNYGEDTISDEAMVEAAGIAQAVEFIDRYEYDDACLFRN